MATVGNKYLLTLRAHSNFSEIAIQNVFAYELTSGSGGAILLGNTFQTNILLPLTDVLSTDVTIDDMYIVNLDDPTDYTTDVIGGNGAVTGDPMPPFVAWEFEYIRADRTVNNGRKAFGTIGESQTSSGAATGAAAILLNGIADLLEAPLVATSPASSWTPKIFRRPGTYASGVVAAPGAFYPISAVRYVRVSTQNTRKVGRGI